MRYVDIGIPANNKGKQSIGCLFWLLARMVLQMRGTILPGHKWDVMVTCDIKLLLDCLCLISYDLFLHGLIPWSVSPFLG